jgi:AraC family transcriptional regulator
LARLTVDETTLAEADQLIAPLFGLATLNSTVKVFQDPRIVEALTFLRESPDAYESLDALANRVHLSPSRFQHLFKEKVGVPVRRYVLWLKMRKALDLAMAGDSLTTAALSAGFADSAHLSRTVRALLGVAPEFLFRHREQLVVHA